MIIAKTAQITTIVAEERLVIMSSSPMESEGGGLVTVIGLFTLASVLEGHKGESVPRPRVKGIWTLPKKALGVK